MTTSSGRHVLGEVVGGGRDNVLGAGFVPRREIPRTPPPPPPPPAVKKRVSGRRDGGKGSNGRLTRRFSAKENQEKHFQETTEWGSPANQLRVQAPCFSPRKTLARSPPPLTPPPPSSYEVTDIPSITKSEILPTPLSTSPPPLLDTQQSPHIESRSSHKENTQPEVRSPPIIYRENEREKRVALPKGLVCTENDLSFLRHLEHRKEQQSLQDQICELDKAVRSAAEEKEQLQYEAQKIESDIRKMKEKYVTTVSDVHSLNPTSDFTHSSGGMADSELSHTHLSKLRQTQRLMAVQLEKTEREIQKKVTEMNHCRQSLEDRREKEQLNFNELNNDLENVQLEKKELEQIVKQASYKQAEMEKQLEDLQSELHATKQVSDTEISQRRRSEDEEEGAAERAAAEERLRQLVKRCNLYVKRHHILKQLRQQN